MTNNRDNFNYIQIVKNIANVMQNWIICGNAINIAAVFLSLSSVVIL